MKFAFRKLLILKEMGFGEQTGPKLKEAWSEIWRGPEKRKAEASSRTPKRSHLQG